MAGEDRAKRKRKYMQARPSKKRRNERELERNGICGVWVSTRRNKERICSREAIDVFEQFAERLYGREALEQTQTTLDDDSDDAAGSPTAREEGGSSIEDDVAKELAAMQQQAARSNDTKHKSGKLFMQIPISSESLVFIRTRAPVDPVELVHAVCQHVMDTGEKSSRMIQRMTPVSSTCRATIDSIRDMAKAVLKPHFHMDGQAGVKFAIRPSIRMSDMKRDEVIKAVAAEVGPGHRVDLRNYDKLILLEIYKNTCGMSVVTDYTKFRGFNISELHDHREDPSG